MKKLALIVFLHVVCLLSCNLDLIAQSPQDQKTQGRRNMALSGEIKLEEVDKKKDPYKLSNEAADSYLNSLLNTIKSGSNGQVQKLPLADDNTLSFLTASYLYCSINNGVCPFFLETLYEADLINARIDKKNSCDNLRSFWKKYIDSDLESRHRHSTKIGFLSQTGEFNQKVRPKYIKCQVSIAKEIEGAGSDSEFFKARYSKETALKSVNETIDYLKSVKDKNINVFNAL